MKTVGQPQKTIIDALQTIFWYRYIETRVVANLYDEEFNKFCQTKGFDISSIELDDKIELLEKFKSPKLNKKEIMFYQTNPNKIGREVKEKESRIWYKYSKCETKPNPVKLQRIDKIIENSSLYFKHPIWKFLKKRPNTRSELDCFFSRFEECSINAIKNKTVLEPTSFHTDHSLVEYEFTKYGNILDFYGYILYSYYVARLELDSKKMDNCIGFFILNLQPILNNMCFEAVFFLKLCQLHMKPFKSSEFEEFEIFNHFRVLGWLEQIQDHLSNEKNKYEFLHELIKEFDLE